MHMQEKALSCGGNHAYGPTPRNANIQAIQMETVYGERNMAETGTAVKKIMAVGNGKNTQGGTGT